MQECNDCQKQINLTIKIKKVEFLPPFLPQIYHKLNLLILWCRKLTAKQYY